MGAFSMVSGSERTLRQSRFTLTATFSLKREGEQESLRVFCFVWRQIQERGKLATFGGKGKLLC